MEILFEFINKVDSLIPKKIALIAETSVCWNPQAENNEMFIKVIELFVEKDRNSS